MSELQEKSADHALQDHHSTDVLNVMIRNAQNALMDGIYQPLMVALASKEIHLVLPNSVMSPETLLVENALTDTETCWMLTQAQSLIASLAAKLTPFHAQILKPLNAELDSLLITKLALLAKPIVLLVHLPLTVLNA